MARNSNASAVAEAIDGGRGGPPHQVRAGLLTGAPLAGEDGPGRRTGGGPPPPLLPGLPLRFSDPLRVLLCWAALLYREGELDARLLSRAGVSAADLSAFADESAEALSELRRLRLAGALFGRRELGALWRARVAEGLMGAARMGEVLALTRALAAAPDWAWEEGEEGPRGEGQGPRAKGRESEARSQRAGIRRCGYEGAVGGAGGPGAGGDGAAGGGTFAAWNGRWGLPHERSGERSRSGDRRSR